MEVLYNDKLIINDEFLNVSETQKEPNIKLDVDSKKLYSLIMYDPDAVKGTFVHLVKVNITSNDIKTGNIIIPYKGPAPPPGTGIHRYIFELYEQSGVNNLGTEKRIVTSIDEIKKKLKIHDLIKKIQFRSKNEIGGKRKKTVKRSKRVVKHPKKRRTRHFIYH
jgi:phosphatidylethanolamine-binding protein (PEBP) family uncharacterized protein